MDAGYTSLPSSNPPDSVPAVIVEEKKPAFNEVSPSNLQIFPPANGGYQAPGTPYGTVGDEQAPSSWKGVFSISSYSPYFNVDTDVVVERILSSIFLIHGDFHRKIDSNPDLYGPVWISTTLVFLLAALGNCATYVMHKKDDPISAWSFDVNYVNWAASVIYGYTLLVPAACYFLLRYLGSNASLIRFWCLWGYSLFVFIPSSVLLLMPSEVLRWIIILLAGSVSSMLVAANLKSYTEGSDLMAVVISAMLLQFALAIFIKVFFFA